MDRKPKAGDIIHYVLLEHRPGEPYQYHEAPAIITRVGDDEIVDIGIFFGGDSLYPCNGNYQPTTVYLTGIHHNENMLDDTWHWIEEFDMPPTVKHVFIDLRNKK